jgi:hypothetical protein
MEYPAWRIVLHMSGSTATIEPRSVKRRYHARSVIRMRIHRPGEQEAHLLFYHMIISGGPRM